MDARRLRNVMQEQGALAGQSTVVKRIGEISGYNPASYAVKVQFPPDAVETGWIPLGGVWIGNGWGMFCPPSIGDQVEVSFQDGGADAPVCGMRFYDADNAPLGVQSGEFWLVHQKGAFFKLTNDGKATFSDGHGAEVDLNGDGTITSKGAWTHQGTMEIQQTLKVDGQTTVQAITSQGVNIGGTHVHGGVATGSVNSAVPH